ncbi:hypothetical protein [Aquimarina sp. AU58]|uniref:hypothetical protein n=1 Tax=Aquimarina sp. AU58 TaxID=1874112 RepID=UPI000D6E0E9A|nr:hypothetical protein [Aquimarina sp. AU58]
MKPTTTYDINPKLAYQFFLLAAVKVISYLIIPYDFFLGSATFSVIAGILQYNLQPIKFYPEYLELKFGPLGSKKFIKHNQITKLQKNTKNVFISFTDSKNVEQTIKIPFRLLTKEDFGFFIEELKEYVKLNRAKSS